MNMAFVRKADYLFRLTTLNRLRQPPKMQTAAVEGSGTDCTMLILPVNVCPFTVADWFICSGEP